jgi:hypothetical protein
MSLSVASLVAPGFGAMSENSLLTSGDEDLPNLFF